jgi:iron complex outermembrane receptor protein
LESKLSLQTYNDVAIRASFSTGFRAPALHQIYLSNIQTLVSGGKISNQGTFNNVDPAVIGLGVPHAEESQNIATGITFRSGLISLRRLPYKSKRSYCFLRG